MTGSLISFLVGSILAYAGWKNGSPTSSLYESQLFLFFPCLLLVSYGFVYSNALSPLQKAELHTSPRIFDLFKKDPGLGFCHLGLIAFPIAAIALSIDFNTLQSIPKAYFIVLWFTLVGATIDLLIRFIRRVMSYLNPFSSIVLFKEAARRGIQNDKETDLCESIDALAEIGNRSLDKGGMNLCNASISQQEDVIRLFLEAAKSISHPTKDKESDALGIADKVTFNLFYLFQRFEMLFTKAVKNHYEPVCSKILSSLGKITIQAAKYDMSLTGYPLQAIGRLSLEAQEDGMPEIALKATCLYLEVSKTILSEIEIAYYDIKPPFLTIIHYMHKLAEKTFKQNKDTPISSLTQPFKDLRSLFEQNKAAAHQDTPSILFAINQVIAEFDALDLVLRTIPSVSALTGIPPEGQPASEEIQTS